MALILVVAIVVAVLVITVKPQLQGKSLEAWALNNLVFELSA